MPRRYRAIVVSSFPSWSYAGFTWSWTCEEGVPLAYCTDTYQVRIASTELARVLRPVKPGEDGVVLAVLKPGDFVILVVAPAHYHYFVRCAPSS